MKQIETIKDKALGQYENALKEKAEKEVIRELRENDILPEEVTKDEMDELITEEIKVQRKRIKSLATGAAGAAIILELLG